MKKTLAKKPKKSASKKSFKRFAKNLAYTLALCLVVLAVLYGVTYLVAFLMKTLIGSKVAQPVWTSVYQAVAYALSLIVLLLLPKILIKLFTKPLKKLITKHPGSKFLRFVARDPLGLTEKNTRDRLGLTGLPTWTDIGLAPIAFVAALLVGQALLSVFSLIFPWFDVSQTQELGYATTIFGVERLLAFIMLCVIAPIVEELVFRGWLYGKQRAKTGAILAIFINAAFFGFLHGQWNVALSVGALGAAACFLREITGTAYSGILLHILKNSVAFVLLFIYGL